ncbi:hypothetical protein Fokcrypt_00716 [Candidatus Fokinia cryptica]|uniref:Uncharacterized protein n=1 Tax=Candidatus Fokinia crypta TaxID=1920990 RepID=A0ABZ0UTB8_9RICK|nr:hypothetical protein Fokcrypt_00716 [Candidatus Fokinia cryptica]
MDKIAILEAFYVANVAFTKYIFSGKTNADYMS